MSATKTKHGLRSVGSFLVALYERLGPLTKTV